MKKNIFRITSFLNAALDNEWECWHIGEKHCTKIDRFFTDGTVLCFVSNASTLRVMESDDEISDIVKAAEAYSRSLEKGEAP